MSGQYDSASRRLRIIGEDDQFSIGRRSANLEVKMAGKQPCRALGKPGECKLTTAMARSIMGMEAYQTPLGMVELHLVLQIDPETADGQLIQAAVLGSGPREKTGSSNRDWLKQVL